VNWLDSALNTLKFDRRWLDFGFIDADFLLESIQRYETSDDQHSEHYRYGAFRHYLKTHPTLTDQNLESYIMLVDIDPDPIMATSALRDLVQRGTLTHEQVTRLTLHPYLEGWIKRSKEERLLLDRLASEGVTDALFDAFMQSREHMQRRLLECNLTQEQIRTLAEHGANKGVRNVARQRLKHA
jgi:hypothetical protein